MSERGFIYGLSHDGNIRYVGKTKGSLSYRLRRHLREARATEPGRRHVFDWIRSVGYGIEIVNLEQDPADLGEAERAWIATARRYGCDLTNGTEGGNGAVIYGRTPWNKGHKGVSPETSARMSEAAKARPRVPRTKEARDKYMATIAAKGEYGHEQRQAAGRLGGLKLGGSQFTAESRRKAGESNRKRWQSYTDEEVRARRTAMREGKARARALRGGDA